MESRKQKISRMFNSYSPKQMKPYLCNGSVDSYLKEIYPSSNVTVQQPSLPKKTISPQHHNKIQRKYAVNKPNRSGKKLSQKYDSCKNYCFNYTAYGTPFDKSGMFSYISTPNQKSYNLNMKTFDASLSKNDGQKSIKSYKRFVTKELEQYPSTEEENFSENSVKVKFLISTQLMSCTSNKNRNNDNCYSGQAISFKTIYRSYSNFVTFASMKSEFLNDKQCLSDKIKQNYFGLMGFQTVPYNYALTSVINQQHEKTFQFFMSKNIRQITLSPILIRRKINYEQMEFKDFQMIKYLGSGGFSSVYLAKCAIDGQMCALKFIKKESLTTAKKFKMLENERSILFTIGHPNLIDLYYAFETANYIVFGLQYCPNGNLYNYLQKKKNLGENQAKLIFKQILDGMEYLHENNILFRDIKLQNILFDGQGNIKITDFGLSKPDITEEDITYSYCGSPQYMAPQMLAKQGHSFGVDYYALGILLFELLYGRSPFYAPKKQQIFTAIMSTDPVFPKNFNISKEAKALIKGLLTKNPQHRIGSLKGIKEIASHPWLRNYRIEDQKQNHIHFSTPYEPENDEFNAQVDQTCSTAKPVGSSIKGKGQNLYGKSIVNTSTKDSENKKWKQIFDYEKQSSNSSRCFFEQSFVNRNLLQKVGQDIIPFDAETKFQSLKSSQVKNEKKTVKNSYLNNVACTVTSQHSRKDRLQDRKYTSKSGSKSKMSLRKQY